MFDMTKTPCPSHLPPQSPACLPIHSEKEGCSGKAQILPSMKKLNSTTHMGMGIFLLWGLPGWVREVQLPFFPGNSARDGFFPVEKPLRQMRRSLSSRWLKEQRDDHCSKNKAQVSWERTFEGQACRTEWRRRWAVGVGGPRAVSKCESQFVPQCSQGFGEA